jgi:hypothetical protein
MFLERVSKHLNGVLKIHCKYPDVNNNSANCTLISVKNANVLMVYIYGSTIILV